MQEKGLDEKDEDAIFKGIEKESGDASGGGGGGAGGWNFGVGAGEGFKPWNLKEEDKEDVFDFPEEDVEHERDIPALDVKPEVDVEQLQKEEQALTAVVKG